MAKMVMKADCWYKWRVTLVVSVRVFLEHGGLGTRGKSWASSKGADGRNQALFILPDKVS